MHYKRTTVSYTCDCGKLFRIRVTTYADGRVKTDEVEMRASATDHTENTYAAILKANGIPHRLEPKITEADVRKVNPEYKRAFFARTEPAHA